MDWTDETIGRLRALWAEGHSTAEIGRRLGITKNAVVGKAHRLNLSARPSPIKRNEGKPPMMRRPAPRPASAPAAASGVVAASAVAAPAPARPAVLPRPAPVLRAVAPSRPSGRMSACCWPIGEPGTQSFHFCSDGAMPGKPYCAAHAAIAYVRVRDRKDDAA